MKRVLLVVPFALLIAACGTTSSPTPGQSAAASSPAASGSGAPSASDVASPSTSASAPASGGASGSPGPSGSGLAGLPHAAPDLEARLPNEINGVTLQKLSVAGTTLMNDTDEDFQSLIQALGASPEDVSVALAGADSELDLTLSAIRVAGAQGSQFIQNMVDTAVAEDEGSTSTQVDLAGRPVVTITSPDAGDTYLVAVGDAVYVVETRDPALAATAVGLLPQN
jgi:hypothetical protein